jgi:hypothetical protein
MIDGAAPRLPSRRKNRVSEGLRNHGSPLTPLRA